MSDIFNHEVDAYESADWSIFEDGGPGNYYSRDHQCFRCGRAGLTWGKNQNGRWQLFSGGVAHICNTTRVFDFDDLTKK